jgi:hypothetical protein
MTNLNQINRTQQILLIALVVQIALAVYTFWPQPAASQGGEPLLPGVTADQVTRLIVTDNTGKRIAVEKKGEGWVLFEAGDYPVKAEVVSGLLTQVEAVKTNRLVTQTEGSHKQLQVAGDDFNRRLELTLADGSSHTLYVGSSGGASATHVRADDQAEVYLSADIEAFSINTQLSGWLETLYFTIPVTATTKMTIENGNGAFVFTREGEAWTMDGLAEGEVLAQDIIDGLRNQASSFRMTEPIGLEEQPEFGLADPAATITLETADQAYTIRIGAQNPDDKSYVAHVSSQPYYIRISDFTGNNFAQKTRADFLEEPPTPTAEPTEEAGEGKSP